MYTSTCKVNSVQEESGHDQDKEEEEYDNDIDDGYNTDDNEVEENDDKFNYVMTHRNNYKEGKKLPEYIKLDDPYPGEPHLMRRRNFPAVLRFHKTNQGNNPQKYMHSELMLYRPISEEIDTTHVEAQYDEMYGDRRKVNLVKSQVMQHLEGVEEGRYYVEQIKKEMDLTEVGNQLDPALEQENADCDEELQSEHPDFLHIDPELIATENNVTNKSIYKKIDIP